MDLCVALGLRDGYRMFICDPRVLTEEQSVSLPYQRTDDAARACALLRALTGNFGAIRRHDPPECFVFSRAYTGAWASSSVRYRALSVFLIRPRIGRGCTLYYAMYRRTTR